MKKLTTALMTKFNETDGGVHNSLYTLVSGKMYKERAPQDAAPPYIVYHIISDVPDWTFDTDFERVRIQFNLYSDEESSSEVEDIYAALRSVYEWKELTVEDWSHVYMRRELARLSKDPEDDMWVWAVDYEILVEQ